MRNSALEQLCTHQTGSERVPLSSTRGGDTRELVDDVHPGSRHVRGVGSRHDEKLFESSRQMPLLAALPFE